ncbi:MAG: FAD-binding oxidoreductase [Gammaproteobacteria bacterium]|nr:FAD-binding oxidoreductase [Gammaproteobacteria bacterium]
MPQIVDDPSATGKVAQALVDCLGQGCVLLDDDVTSRGAGVWRSDHINAKILVRPRSTDEVSQALRICHEHGQTVVAHGGLTGLVGSALTTQDDVVISLERMNQIETINPLERTVIVQAGVILQTLQEAVAEQGLMYPLDLGGRGSCTIGGNISTNAGGNRVIRYGMTRDMVLGLEAVLADGTIVSSMNQMIKNNAGYDLKQLFIGTEGTLGIVTRAVLRCREQVASQPTMLVGLESFEKLVQFLKAMDGGLCGSLSAFEVMWNNYYRLVTTLPATHQPPLAQHYPYYVLVEAMGADSALVEKVLQQAFDDGLVGDVVIAQSDAQCQQIWAIRDDVGHAMEQGAVLLFDVSLRIPYMEAYVEKVNAALQQKFPGAINYTLGHVGDGNLHFAIGVGEDSAASREGVEACVYEPLAAIGGSVSAEHGVGLEKKAYLDISRTNNEIELMRCIKRALDPKDILNRGKIFDQLNDA